MAGSRRNKAGESAYRKTTLRNGLRVITERVPGVRSISLGVWVDVGSRFERPDENGLSHFIEHLVFKGTRRRNARQIASSLESIGGSLNAFTTREHTCYTARVLDDLLPEAIDVLADITCHPTLTPVNMKREKQVIIEEIKESLDNPADHIHDLFSATHWGGHPLGYPIMGTEKTIRAVPRARLLNFWKRNYRTGSVVVAASGSISHDRLVRLVREKFDLPSGLADATLPVIRPDGPQTVFQDDGNSQTQFCLGFPGIPYHRSNKMALVLLTSHLGGGMSSVLFQKIREQRGLAYSVFAYHDFFKDAGVFGVYLGTDKVHLREAYDVIMAELRRMKKRKLTVTALDKVKAQVKGHLTLGMESTSTRMHRLGRMELLVGEYQDLSHSLQSIDDVTPSDIAAVAEEIFDETRISLAILGPADPKQFDDVDPGPRSNE